MKKFTKYILFISLGLLCSCSDYLDIVPDNVTTLDIVFNNKNTAQRYLANGFGTKEMDSRSKCTESLLSFLLV